jgi:hypothetical protein
MAHSSVIPVKMTPQIILALIVLVFGVGFGFGKYLGGRSLGAEGFTSSVAGVPVCSSCNQNQQRCSCTPKGMARLICPPCREPDMSKYVLKSSVPPCPACPDMSLYMLKTECPPTADLSKYVLKSSIPKQQPVIIDNSACKKDAGECPPCPRPRCPTVKCPSCPSCPQPAPCPRPVCPQTQVKCKAEPAPNNTVRPFLAPLNMSTFGTS